MCVFVCVILFCVCTSSLCVLLSLWYVCEYGIWCRVILGCVLCFLLSSFVVIFCCHLLLSSFVVIFCCRPCCWVCSLLFEFIIVSAVVSWLSLCGVALSVPLCLLLIARHIFAVLCLGLCLVLLSFLTFLLQPHCLLLSLCLTLQTG